MCKNIAIALGGDIVVESKTGEGTKFTFWVKDFNTRNPDIGPKETLSNDKSFLKMDSECALKDTTGIQVQTYNKSLCDCSKVLIVDDESMNIFVIRSYLKIMGIKGDEVML